MIKNKEQLIANTGKYDLKKARKRILNILEEVLKEIDPSRIVGDCVRLNGNELVICDKKRFNLNRFKNIYVVGAGKATFRMASMLEPILKVRITAGHINVPDAEKGVLKKIECTIASHPIPDEKGVEGAEKIMEIASNAGKDDLVIVLLSGGGSALMPLPIDEISLEEKMRMTKELIKKDVTINELNTVRKKLSKIKGGKLAKAAYPATVLSLIVSDVVNDDLSVIASAPTADDDTTFEQAVEILKKNGMWDDLSDKLKEYFNENMDKQEKKNHNQNVHNILLFGQKKLAEVTERIIKKHDSTPKILTTSMQGEAGNVGAELIKKAIKTNKDNKPTMFIAVGETTVDVKGKGCGGRNQELVLSAAELIDSESITIISFATDGVDGFCPEAVAGAIADNETKKKAENMKLDIKAFLNNNDSYSFFKRLGENILTGPTGTNVGDLVLVWVE